MIIEDGIFMAVMDELEDGIYILDPDRRIAHWNRSAEKITGYSADEVVGRYCQENLLDHIDMRGRPLCIVGCPMYDTLCDGERRSAEVLLRHKNGHRVAVGIKSVAIRQRGKITGAIEIFTPNNSVAGYSELLDALSEKVMTDPLTGLSNRRHLHSYLEYKLKEYQRFGRLFCVLFMDIDNFRDFNNTYGHPVGDLLLKAISTSFLQNLRGTDLIGRWGGEEFLGVFSIADSREAQLVGEKVRMLVANSGIVHQGRQISVTSSVGVAVVQEGDSLDSIVERADRFMYLSKEHGKNRITAEGTCGEVLLPPPID